MPNASEDKRVADSLNPPPEHTRVRGQMRVLGAVLVVVGAMLTAIAVGDLFLTIIQIVSDRDPASIRFPVLFLLGFVGLPMFGVGLMLLQLGYLGAISKFLVREQAPAAAEGVNRVLPATQDAVTGLARAVRTA